MNNKIHIDGIDTLKLSHKKWIPLINNPYKDTLILKNMDIFTFRKFVMLLRGNTNIKSLKCIGLTLDYDLICFLEKIAKESTLKSIEFHNFSTKNLLKTISNLRKYFPDFFV